MKKYYTILALLLISVYCQAQSPEQNLKNAMGDLNKVKRIVKVFGMVNSTETFTDQSKVINGFSDLMIQVFGDKGKHARSAVGMIALPMNMAVEIEMIVEVEN